MKNFWQPGSWCFIRCCVMFHGGAAEAPWFRWIPSLEAKFGEHPFTIDLSLNHLKVEDVDVLVPWLKKYLGLRIVINHNDFNLPELWNHFERKDDAFQLIRLLTTGRLHFSSTLLHLLTESVFLKQMEKIKTVSDKTEKLQNWQKMASFAVEDEVNCLIRNYYEALGYAVAPLAPGARSAGLAMLSPKIPVKGKPVQHLYSFDAAYQLAKEDEELVVLGEVKHSLDTRDVQDFWKKVSLFEKRLKRIQEGTLPMGSPAFNAQNNALKRYLGARIKAFVGTVHVQPAALAAAAKAGYDVVLPGGARFELKTADEAQEMAKLWSATAPSYLQAEEDEC
ncbi:hypothetical protein VOLCADRAFT_104748 [Volvox carteri f. nagariensis]|uniref:Uncharacterized protein n=1 Tax=Volvox carteri f. nagariensis TaxID=3068 RepID=D8TVT8_VOLCA|nr:uncharacterized protein VOLCADRAFT_104748 [Volvox carteri f. nagariensis]EFJ48253.1 hypothetical protein VOLCADRAFT_104748 [Volvox carteri f. nagariensis]|eukprot:XP_002950507.1 hypothetical protein VOLCADRAFT_104748 [Volvox carteri f. nagariensis]